MNATEIKTHWLKLDGDTRKRIVFFTLAPLLLFFATHSCGRSRQVAGEALQRMQAVRPGMGTEQGANALGGAGGAAMPLQSAGAYLGTWQGNTIESHQGFGLCSLSLEIRLEGEKTYLGYPVMTCNTLPGLLGQPAKTPEEVNANYLRAMARANPMTAILSGTQGPDGMVHFTVRQMTATNDTGCVWKDFSAVPFGEKKLSASWSTDKCGSGSVLLAKGRGLP